MSRKPRLGGTVMISGGLYTVLEGPLKRGTEYRIMIRAKDDEGVYWAASPNWRGGRGPWVLRSPPTVATA
jgi:hypothetical protein